MFYVDKMKEECPDEYRIYWYDVSAAHTSTPTQLITKEEAIQERPDAFASLIEKHQ